MAGKKEAKRLAKYVPDYVVFDLETTGISCVNDQIIEISAVKAAGGKVVDTFSTLVNPQCAIPYSATRVNGITDEMVAEAPCIQEALEGFLAFIKGHVLVGHNIHSFDLNFIIDAAMGVFGRDVRNNYVDTLYMARNCLPKLPHYKLSDVANHFGISAVGAHRALNDCVINQGCYESLGKILIERQKVEPEAICPKCGAEMVKRSGKYGEFYGCSDFPRCRGTRKL